MTRWSAIPQTRGRRSALAYGSRSPTAANQRSTGSYTPRRDATALAAGDERARREARKPTSRIGPGQRSQVNGLVEVRDSGGADRGEVDADTARSAPSGNVSVR